MKASRVVLVVSAVIFALSIVSVANSTPPSPPPVGSYVPVGANPSASFIPQNVDANGNLMVNDIADLPSNGTLYPGSATPPASSTGCYSVAQNPGALIEAWMVSPAAQPAGSTLEFYDENDGAPGTAGTCAAANRIYSTGQVGAGWVYPRSNGPLVYQLGLAFQVVSGSAFGSDYGMKFRTIP